MPDRRERVLDWRDELRRLTPLLAELPLAARLAVMQTAERFAREDGSDLGESLVEPPHRVPDAA
jgi:hypothetical protein